MADVTIAPNIADRPALGAKVLDERKPGWYKTVHGAITAGYFRMSEWDTCIVGVLEMRQFIFDGWYVIKFNGTEIADHAEAIACGFILSDYELRGENWDILDEAWKREVNARIEADKRVINNG